MELIITSSMNPESLPEIQWNAEALKNEIAQKAQEYKNIAYTAEQSAEMKKDRAKLNALVTAIEDQRKAVKRFYQVPYEKFEAQVKEVLAPVREAISLIDSGLAEIEEKYRQDKQEKMNGYYEAEAGDLKSLIPFERTVKGEYYKRTFTDKKLEQAYKDFFFRVREDLLALEELPEQYRDKAALKYVESFSLSDALREGKRLEEMERVMKERRARKEAEAQAAAKRADVVPPAQVTVTEEGPVVPQDITEKKLQLDFRVRGTRQQLMALKKFMEDNGIEYGKVEK